MAEIHNKTAADQPLSELLTFQQQTIALLKQYQRDRVVDANTQRYQEDLKRIVKETNGILKSGKITTRDSNKLDSLLGATERQYTQMKANNASDVNFQKNFVKVFGKQQMEGSVAKMMVENLGKTIAQFTSTLKQATQPISKNLMDTALFTATGPFGKMAEQSINFRAISDAIKGHHANKMSRKSAARSAVQDNYSSNNIGRLDTSLKGIFAGGATDIPDSGSYYLHKGERVVAPPQNQDLSSFLQKVQTVNTSGAPQHPDSSVLSPFMKQIDSNVKIANKLLEAEVASGYFDPIIENDDRLFIIGQKDRFMFSKRLFQNLEVLELGVFKVGMTVYGSLIKLGLGFERFMRHPIFYSADAFFSPLIKKVFTPMTNLWRSFFPKKKDEEERIYDVLTDIYEFITKEKRNEEEPKGLAGKFGEKFIKGITFPIWGPLKLLGLTTKTAYAGLENIFKSLHTFMYKYVYGVAPVYETPTGAGATAGATTGAGPAASAARKRQPKRKAKSGHVYPAWMTPEDIAITEELNSTLAAGYGATRATMASSRTGMHPLRALHRSLFGEPQQRDEKGRFLPQHIGLFGHAKNVGHDILGVLTKSYKENKKHHSGFFGLLLTFGGMLLDGLIGLFSGPLGWGLLASLAATAIGLALGTVIDKELDKHFPKTAGKISNILGTQVNLARASQGNKEALSILSKNDFQEFGASKYAKTGDYKGFLNNKYSAAKMGLTYMGGDIGKTEAKGMLLTKVYDEKQFAAQLTQQQQQEADRNNRINAQTNPYLQKSSHGGKSTRAPILSPTAAAAPQQIIIQKLSDINVSLQQLLPPTEANVKATQAGAKTHVAAAVGLASSIASSIKNQGVIQTMVNYSTQAAEKYGLVQFTDAGS